MITIVRGMAVPEMVSRDAYGARACVSLADERNICRWVRADGSYASANDPRLLLGLGKPSAALDVDVLWPDGSRERWIELEAGRYHTLRRGEGKR